MAIVGIYTSLGISKSIEAQNNEGFKIFVQEFGVSRIAGALDSATTVPNSGLWYQAPVSTRVKIDSNTVKVVCSIPSGVGLVKEDIREIYLFGKDSDNNSFLMAIGQPTEVIKYDPTGTVTFELQISLVDIDLTKNYVFNNTRSTELDEHKTDPNAHPEIPEALAKAGIYIPLGAYPFKYFGQNFDEYAEFAGNKATANYSGITFTARLRGDELNGQQISFDGLRTVDEIVASFNALHPKDTVIHSGAGTEVLPAGITTLGGGTYSVAENDLVYRDVDGLYKKALADGTIKAKVVGMAFLSDKLVKISGLISKVTGFAQHDDLYLSATEAGKITNISSSVKIGVQLSSSVIILGGVGGSGSGGGVDAGYDAIVSDEEGYKQYPTVQDAINSVPNNGFILVKKMDELKQVVRTNGKVVNVLFRGYSTGLKRFDGKVHKQRIVFSQVPTSGTWRLEFKELYSGVVQSTNDMPYNANASLIQTELNALDGHSGCVVTGDYATGFTITFNDMIKLPLITIADGGQNEIQRFNFNQVPDDGTCDFEFDGFSGVNHAFNDSPAMLESLLEALPSIADIDIRGSFDDRFYEIEFIGADGLRNKSQLVMSNANLNVGGSGGFGGTPITVNGSSTFPVVAQIIAEGRFPANNLKNNLDAIEVTISEYQTGEPVGPTKAIELDSDTCQFIGMGRITGFNTGLNMSSYLKTRIELNFDSIQLPIDGKDQIIDQDFSFDGSIGVLHKDFTAKSRWEVPTGAVDGVNTAYTLLYVPNFNKEAIVTRDGLALPSSWWSITGNTLNITDPRGIINVGQYIEVKYTPDILAFTPDISYYPWATGYVAGVKNQLDLSVPFSYNRGSSRIEVYRNGLRLVDTIACGELSDQYEEINDNKVSVNMHQQNYDLYHFVNKDYRVLSSGYIWNKDGVNVLSLPKYTMGTHTLRIWRNGLLMNASGLGASVDKYTETSSTSITLALATSIDDVFYYEVLEFNGTRADLTGLTSASVTVPYTMASGKVVVFRNGIKLVESTTLGGAIDRFQVTGNFTLNLGVALASSDVLTVIVNNE